MGDPERVSVMARASWLPRRWGAGCESTGRIPGVDVAAAAENGKGWGRGDSFVAMQLELEHRRARSQHPP